MCLISFNRPKHISRPGYKMLNRLYSTRKELKILNFSFFESSCFLFKYFSLFFKLHSRLLLYTILHELFFGHVWEGLAIYFLLTKDLEIILIKIYIQVT